jgi:hypothetical protein
MMARMAGKKPHLAHVRRKDVLPRLRHGYATVDLGSGSASTCADSAVSRAYDACHTLHAPTCLTSDKTRYVPHGVDTRALEGRSAHLPQYAAPRVRCTALVWGRRGGHVERCAHIARLLERTCAHDSGHIIR